jgi:undecaprenyl-diphosphatase
MHFDAAVFDWIVAHRSPLLDRAMVPLSYAGGLAWLGLAVLLGLARRDRWAGIFQVMLAIGLSALLADTVVKPLVGRDRPYVVDATVKVLGGRLANPSFPSTHAANAVAGAYALGRVFPAAAPFFWLLAILIGLSRVYVGLHYPLDVLFGGLVGLAAAAFVAGGTRWGWDGKREDGRRKNE